MEAHIPIQLSAVGVQHTEHSDINISCFTPQESVGRTAKETVEKKSLITIDGP
ncbi:hypothetical protein VCRA2119O147_1000007 [Vibrio crassostreae]|uniref:Uncharacterized protein n=1 Tax=Vibrio crassostreae TaxID=246167 RepID=A0A822MTE4_9VIBR|nr:hypothetical protein VCRA2119O381_1430002 [Vibrio crassostreae]CAK2090777.1 hypothetical protein VCRA2116O31_460002 [Vibrio crassostreae]CAK2098611.1 hypothetical protein VCRA2117O37_490002 [Vibrio crassostreae]CAK2103337.1 hypothetical protein VCRA2116O26_470006 [Vibrio crassostreae]CAK2110254.1 hypothetical protein VCRA2113O324_480006 [Vibrio crassostreae]